MSYQAQEESRQLGNPKHLYLFRWGSTGNSYMAFTNGDEDYVYDAGDGLGPVTYEKATIKHSRLRTNGTMKRETLEVEIQGNALIVQRLHTFIQANVFTCIIFEYHGTDSVEEKKAIWVSRVVSTGRTRSEPGLKIVTESAASALRRPMLRRHWQVACPHVLYQGLCLANKAAATVAATVSAVNGRIITLPANWYGAFNPAKFIQGTLEWTDPVSSDVEIRTVWRRNSDSTQLWLNNPINGIAATHSVNIVLGCNHLIDDCDNLHAVPQSYGGWPYFPDENPVNYISFYY